MVNLSLGRFPVGFLFGDRVMIGRMPRYFFLLAYPDQEVGDPHGVIAQSDETAIHRNLLRSVEVWRNRGVWRVPLDESRQ